MAEASPAKALSSAAQTLRASAREHKRASAAHRNQAKRCMQELEKLRIFCEQNGITLEIQTQTGGGKDHGHK